MEAEERRKWEDAYRTAKAMNDDSPATIEKLEADKAIIAEAVANQHALKQKICDLDPAVAERVRRQQQYGGRQKQPPSPPTSSVRWPPAARWAVERAVDRAAMWTTHPRLRATWRSWPGRCRNHDPTVDLDSKPVNVTVRPAVDAKSLSNEELLARILGKPQTVEDRLKSMSDEELCVHMGIDPNTVLNGVKS